MSTSNELFMLQRHADRMHGLMKTKMDSLQREVIQRIGWAQMEAMRLEELAAMSGALPGEWRIVWRFSTVHYCVWPFLR
jgi:hypothetical protein